MAGDIPADSNTAEIINGYQFHKFEYETGKEIKMF